MDISNFLKSNGQNSMVYKSLDLSLDNIQEYRKETRGCRLKIHRYLKFFEIE